MLTRLESEISKALGAAENVGRHSVYLREEVCAALIAARIGEPLDRIADALERLADAEATKRTTDNYTSRT